MFHLFAVFMASSVIALTIICPCLFLICRNVLFCIDLLREPQVGFAVCLNK